MCDRYVVGEIQGYDVIYIPEKDIVFCKNTAISKYSVQSYLRQVELSRTKDMSGTPEKKFVDALLEVLHIEKNEKTFATFIRMMESAHGEEMSEYEEK